MFEVYNELGELQADAVSSVYSLKQKTLAVPASAGSSYSPFTGWVLTVVVNNAVAPFVIAGRPPSSGSGRMFLASLDISGSTWTFKFISDNSASVNFYVFDYTDAAVPSSSYGLQTFDATGKRVFDAIGGKPLKLISTPTNMPTGSGTTTPVPSGKVYGAGIMYGTMRTDQNRISGEIKTYFPIVSISPIEVFTGHSSIVHTDETMVGEGLAGSTRYIVVDLTDL